MIGYFAEYDSGEIILEDEEIEEAYWFNLNKLLQFRLKAQFQVYLFALISRIILALFGASLTSEIQVGQLQ